MPVYQYECSECNNREEIVHSIGSNIQTCPVCNLNTFRIVIESAPYVSCKNYNTIGSIADKNWKSMGHYEKEHKMEVDGLNQLIEKREEKKHKNKLAKLTPKQKTKYIETGEL